MKLKKLFEFLIPQEVDSSRMTTFIKKSFREEGILFCKYTILILKFQEINDIFLVSFSKYTIPILYIQNNS